MFKLVDFKSDAAFWPLSPAGSASGAPASLTGKLLALVTAAPRLLLREMAARRAALALDRLDDRMLKDIGISREEIDCTVRRGRGALQGVTRWL